MRVTLDSTEKLVEVRMPNGAIVPARIWQGKTASGSVRAAVCTTRLERGTPVSLPTMPSSPSPEKAIQASIVRLLEVVGARVYVLGHARRRGDFPGTMQTPGLPDLFAFLPPPRVTAGGWTALWVEVKAPGGRVRPEQAVFQCRCHEANVPHVVGGVDQVVGYLTAGGWLRAPAPRATSATS